jgi:hypothetical protein
LYPDAIIVPVIWFPPTVRTSDAFGPVTLFCAFMMSAWMPAPTVDADEDMVSPNM